MVVLVSCKTFTVMVVVVHFGGEMSRLAELCVGIPSDFSIAEYILSIGKNGNIMKMPIRTTQAAGRMVLKSPQWPSRY